MAETTEIKFRPVDEMTYTECVSELEGLIRKMQSDECDIDRLAAYTRRATELLRNCRMRLTATDEELRAILSELEA